MFAQLPPATRAILFLNIGVFLAQLATRHALDELFALMPLGPYFHAWQLVTYAFLHANWSHIFFNMLALYMFGGALERSWGPQRFVVYYLACVLAAALVQLATMTLSGVEEPTIGASGGVFGLLLAFALYFPRQRIILLFPPIPMPAWLFVTLYGLLELFLGVSGYQMGVAHFAHLGGSSHAIEPDRLQAHRAALRATGVTEHAAVKSAAAKDAAVGERDPVTGAHDSQIAHTHV